MKLRSLRVWFVVIIILVIGVYMINQMELISSHNFHDNSAKQSRDPTLTPYANEIEAIIRGGTTSEEIDEKTKNLVSKLPEKYGKYFEYGVHGAIGEMNFYGRIIDQYGNPVVGANVWWDSVGRYYASGRGRGEAVTDSEGVFKIHAEGAKIMLGGITHPDIVFSYPPSSIGCDTCSLDANVKTMMFHDIQPTSDSSEPLWHETSYDNPYLLNAWRVDEFEEVKHGGLPNYSLVPDGRLYTYNLNGNSMDLHSMFMEGEGNGEGHIRVSCKRDLMDTAKDFQDWVIKLMPIDGGIRAADDYYLNVAPEAGYQSEIVIDMSRSEKNYKKRIVNQRYYFTAHNREIYGSLFVHYDPHAWLDKCSIIFQQYKINVNGSRNLAIKTK